MLSRKRKDHAQSQHWLLAQPRSHSSMTPLRIYQFGRRASTSTKNGVRNRRQGRGVWRRAAKLRHIAAALQGTPWQEGITDPEGDSRTLHPCSRARCTLHQPCFGSDSMSCEGSSIAHLLEVSSSLQCRGPPISQRTQLTESTHGPLEWPRSGVC